MSSQYPKRLLLIVDGSNLAHRAFEKFRKLKTTTGIETGLLYGFLKLLYTYVIRFKPTYLIITFDTHQSKESNFRNKLLGSYKVHRQRINKDYVSFNSQMKVLKRILKYLDIPIIWDSKGLGHESDDYIGYFSNKHQGRVLILSSDKDFCQLIDDRVKIFNPSKDSFVNVLTCKDIMGYKPQECVDYLCLVGDTSDDIPGYKGIGKVKARKFLDEFGTIENFIKSKGEFPGIDLEGIEDLYKRNKELIDIQVALKKHPIKKVPIIRYRGKGINKEKIVKICQKYCLVSFILGNFIEPFKKLRRWEEN